MNVNPRRAPAQVKWPSRSTIRTVFQAFIGIAAMAPLVYSAATDHDAKAASGYAAVALAICAGVTRVMALPGVEQWLQTYVPFLSAKPKESGHLRRAYGRRPPVNKRSIRFGDIPVRVRGQLKAALPASFDAIKGWGGWNMLGNDAAGDCVAVTWATVVRIVTRLYGSPTGQAYPGQDAVWAIYKTQNPGFDPNGTSTTNGPGSVHDGGMSIQLLLEYLLSTGGPAGKILAFASIDPKNIDQIKEAAATFGFVWLGVNVTDANEAAFPKPWSYRRGDKVLGGHSITLTGYYQSGGYPMQTWADEGSLTSLFMANLVEEAWVVVWPEHALHLDAAARKDLNAVFRDVTGRDIDFSSVPLPEPPPVVVPPTDPPGSTSADTALWKAVKKWVLARNHGVTTRPIAAALLAWAKSHGFSTSARR